MKQNLKSNKYIVTHIIKEFFGKGDLSRYDSFISRSVNVHCPENWNQLLPASKYNCLEATRQIDEAYSRAFCFNTMDVCDLIADGNKVCVRWMGEGVHRADFFSLPATHRTFSISGQSIYCFNEEGQVEEAWQAWDLVGTLVKLGYQKNQDVLDLLSMREKECLKLFLEGKTSKETALQLHLSPRTIEYYFENIKDKFGCNSKREIYKLATQNQKSV